MYVCMYRHSTLPATTTRDIAVAKASRMRQS